MFGGEKGWWISDESKTTGTSSINNLRLSNRGGREAKVETENNKKREEVVLEASGAWSMKWKWGIKWKKRDVYTCVIYPCSVSNTTRPFSLMSLFHTKRFIMLTLVYLLSPCHDHQPPKHYHGKEGPDQGAELHSTGRAAHYYPLGERGHSHWRREKSPLLHQHQQKGGWSHLHPKGQIIYTYTLQAFSVA